MKRILFFLLLCISVFYTQAQTYVGYNYGNYNGVIGATFNPANIANSQYKFDFNLFSINALAATNAYSFKSKNLWKFDFDNLTEGVDYFKKNDGKDKNMWANIDILGPSFMFNLSPKSSIAITTRARMLLNEDNLQDSIFQILTNGSEASLFNRTYKQNNLKADAHGFGEVGLTYARTLFQNENHLVSGGLTAKYLVGLASASARMNNVNINLKSENAINDLSGEASLLYSKGIDKFIGDNDNNISWSNVAKDRGWGFDVGITYEWRPQGNTQYFETREMDQESPWLTKIRTPYKLKFGLSVTDIGSIKYALTDNSKSYRVKAGQDILGNTFNQNQLELKDGETADEYINRLKATASSNLSPDKVLTELGTPSSYKVSLPTMLHANVDYQLYKHLFINANANLNLVGKNAYGTHYVSNVTVTPRVEYKWLTLYSPVSYNQRTGLDWGVGLNLGAFYIGSGSVLTGLMKSEVGNIDVHAGVHIPIYKPRAKKPREEKSEEPLKAIKAPHEPVREVKKEEPKAAPVVVDTDGDGIPDDQDKCPTIAGVAKYQGCPVPDTDGDGIDDEHDKCPTVAGVARYQGCPVPDTDGDGIDDEHDKCPNTPGTAANNGCPEIKKEVVEKVNYAARGIKFATGSDKLLPVSFAKLDEVYNLMTTTPALMLRMEGYTDNTGNPVTNQKLSEKRANAVKKYFISKGISSERLSAEGFGQVSPLASNKTAAGRAQNRRVEMKLQY